MAFDHAAYNRQYAILNKEKMAEYQREYYLKNRTLILKRTRASNVAVRAANNEVVLKHLNEYPCVDCGMHDLNCLEFDHVRGEKVAHISQMKWGASTKALIAEIAKCEVRCANCHRKKTAKQFNYYRHRPAEPGLP